MLFTHKDPLSIQKSITKEVSGLEIVPMVDVLLNVLLIVLLGGVLVMPRGIPVNLGTVDEVLAVPAQITSTLTVSGLGVIALNHSLQDERSLLESLHAEVKQCPEWVTPRLLIKLDKDARIEQLNDLCELAYQAGFKSVHMANRVLPKV